MTIKLWHILVALGVMIVLLVYLTFSRSKPTPNYKELIAAKDETIKVLKDQRSADSVRFAMDIENERRNDSLLQAAFNQNQTKYKPLIQKYENIPIDIRRLDRENLRLAAIEAATE